MTTLFLAALWGPTLLAIGIGFFTARSYYKRLYKDLDKQPLALLLLTLIAIPVGITHVIIHNSWGSLPEIIVSLLGWSLLIKGIVYSVFPRFVDKIGDYEADHGFLPYAGGLCIVLGAYLTFVAFFM